MRNTHYILICFFLFLLGCTHSGRNKQTEITSPTVEEKPLILLFAGDVMNHIPQSNAAYISSSNSYDYRPCFQYVKTYIENADVAFCNLEFPLAGKPYSGFPTFSGPDEMLDALQWIGFDVIQTANNHMMDRGNVGNQRTIKEIVKRGLKFVGSYTGVEQKDSVYPLIISKSNFKLAILNYTYSVNLHIMKPSKVNILDSIAIKNDILKARSLGTDFIVATVHWGDEYQLVNNSYQRKWVNVLINSGVDLIVGSHPHVVQNFEIIQHGKTSIPVFYSLGNFISNQREKNKNGGILARIEIDMTHKILSNVSYHPFYVFKGVLNNKYQYFLLPTDDYIADPSSYSIPMKDSVELMYFHHKTKETLNNIPTYQERL
ncbi:MAG: CapA family protein [Paludibacteraceae bacterium]